MEEDGNDSLRRLTESLLRLDKLFGETDHAYRFLLVLIQHSLEALEADPNTTRQAGHKHPETASKAALRVFEKRTRLPQKRTARYADAAKLYTMMASYFGIGILLLLGEKTREL